MGMSEHVKEEIKELHPKKGKGCLWSHESGYGPYRAMDCHYRRNGFKASAGRDDLYNKKEHRQNAVEARYADWVDSKHKTIARRGDGRQRFERQMAGAEGERTGSKLAKFRSAHRKRFNDALSRLERDEEAWHYGVKNTAQPERGKVALTFKPLDPDNTDSLGAGYPYSHQYHHLIANAAFSKHVIAQENRHKRIRTLLATKWNINKGENIVCLPTELWTSAIVELPAHCPWWTRDHPEYSDALTKRLTRIGSQVTQAMGKGKKCKEKLGEISAQLDELSKDLLQEIADLAPVIRKRRGGVELGKAT